MTLCHRRGSEPARKHLKSIRWTGIESGKTILPTLVEVFEDVFHCCLCRNIRLNRTSAPLSTSFLITALHHPSLHRNGDDAGRTFHVVSQRALFQKTLTKRDPTSNLGHSPRKPASPDYLLLHSIGSLVPPCLLFILNSGCAVILPRPRRRHVDFRATGLGSGQASPRPC